MARCKLITTEAEWDEILEEIIKAKWIGFDTEFHGPLELWKKPKKGIDYMVDIHQAIMTGFSVAWGVGSIKSAYIPCRHDVGTNIADGVAKLGALVEAAETFGIRVWMHNSPADIAIIKRELGRYPTFDIGDSMVLCQKLGVGIPERGIRGIRFKCGLKEMAKKHLGVDMTEFKDIVSGVHLFAGPTNEDIFDAATKAAGVMFLPGMATGPMDFGKGMLTKEQRKLFNAEVSKLKKLQVWSKKQFNTVLPEDGAEYAAKDAWATLSLAVKFAKSINTGAYQDQFLKVDMPYCVIVTQEQERGILIDQAALADVKACYRQKVAKIDQEWLKEVGIPLNQNIACSQKLFPDVFPIVPETITKKGNPSISDDALDFILRRYDKTTIQHKLASIALGRNSTAAVLNNHIRAVETQLKHRPDGRIRGSIIMNGAHTHRDAVSGPNLMAMPRDKAFRDIFVAPPGRVFLDADFEGYEIALMAHFSQDPNLLEVVASGESMHDRTAKLLGLPRHDAKAVNLGKNYGMGPTKLAIALGRTLCQYTRKDGTVVWGAPEEVIRIFNEFDATYSGVTQFAKDAGEVLERQGFVTTWSGRKVFYPDIFSGSKKQKDDAKRQAANAIIQGSAADIIKRAMVALNKLWQESRPSAQLLLQIHDELLCEVDEDEAEEAAKELEQTMINIVQLSVPLRVSVKIGKTWGDAH